MRLHREGHTRHLDSYLFLLQIENTVNTHQIVVGHYLTLTAPFLYTLHVEVDIMRGSLVIARDYRGEPLVRRVWDSGSKLVYLSEESQFQHLSTGKNGLIPVGFPVEDVFGYDPKAVEEIARGSLDWSSLQRFDALSRNDQGITFVK